MSFLKIGVLPAIMYLEAQMNSSRNLCTSLLIRVKFGTADLNVMGFSYYELHNNRSEKVILPFRA
jgi:hypothetical protein